MAAVRHPCYVSETEYLQLEEKAETKSEWVNGAVYVMSDRTERHHLIVSNLHFAIGTYLEGSPCRAYVADMKIRVGPANDEAIAHYYPDLAVICGPIDPLAVYRGDPKVLIEVASPSTYRYDRTEKPENYMKIPELEEYIIIEQDRPAAILRRRENGFREEFAGPADSLQLRSIELTIPFERIYRGLNMVHASPINPTLATSARPVTTLSRSRR